MKIFLMPWKFTNYYAGGMEMCVWHLARRLKEKCHKVIIVASKLDFGEKSFEIKDGIEIYRLPFPQLQFMKKGDFASHKRHYLQEVLKLPYLIIKMLLLLIRKRPDVINMHYVGHQSIVVLVLTYLIKFKFVLTLHGYSTQHLARGDAIEPMRKVFKKLLARADFITGPSASLIEDALRWEAGVRKKYHVIPNGVDLDEFNTEFRVTQMRRDVETRISERYIYSDYTYWPNKNYGLLLFAYRAILDSGYDIDLVLSVRDGKRSKYDKILDLLGVKQRVKIIDYKTSINKDMLLKNADFYISLSRGSFCDSVALTALSLGKRIIADARNDLRKINGKQDSIVFIDSDNESEIFSGLEMLLMGRTEASRQKEDTHLQESGFEGAFRVSPYILAVGNLYRYKGISTLIKAFHKVSPENPGLNLVIAGDGRQRGFLERFSKRIGLGDKVIFLGTTTRSETVRLFKDCEFFVLPSWVEPFGIVNLEAMAAGKAIISTTVDGIPEIATDGFNGILVEPRNSNALASAMMSLLRDKELRERLVRNGKTTVEDPRFCWDRITEEYLEVYNRDYRVQRANARCMILHV